MGELVKMKIIVLENGNPTKNEFELKINPSALSVSKEIQYSEDKVQGSSAEVTKYDKHGPTTLNFDFILDATGIAYPKTEDIHLTVKKFEDVVYKMEGKIHTPNTLQISWGSFLLNCCLVSLKYDYTLFSPNGNPLRVKISTSFSGHIKRDEEAKTAQKESPDLSHCVTLKAGETIAYWCHKIYGDFSYCKDIAEFNHIANFRNIKPGTKILFPKLLRNG